MRTIIPLTLALLSGASAAAPLPAQSIANMQAQSEWVMEQGLCAVANDAGDYKAETILLILPAPVGPRRILKNDYNWLRNSAYQKAPSGRYVMTERIGEACRADALGGRCLAARSLWDQNWKR